jgi:hypothetical protein
MEITMPKPTRAQRARSRFRASAADAAPFDPRAVLESIARDERAPPLARIAAAQALLDRPEKFEDMLTRR